MTDTAQIFLIKVGIVVILLLGAFIGGVAVQAHRQVKVEAHPFTYNTWLHSPDTAKIQAKATVNKSLQVQPVTNRNSFVVQPPCCPPAPFIASKDTSASFTLQDSTGDTVGTVKVNLGLSYSSADSIFGVLASLNSFWLKSHGVNTVKTYAPIIPAIEVHKFTDALWFVRGAGIVATAWGLDRKDYKLAGASAGVTILSFAF